MAKSDHIEHKIKDGFESVKHKAPEGVWSSINDNLDGHEQAIDEKVKSGFENKDNIAPDGIWEGIEKQLKIDRGWAKVHTLLMRRTFYKWTKRAAAILIFLFFVTTELNNTFSEKEGAKLSENKNEFQHKENEQKTPQVEETSTKIASSSKKQTDGINSDEEKNAFNYLDQSLNDNRDNSTTVSQSGTKNVNYQNGLSKDDNATSLENKIVSRASADGQNNSDSFSIGNLPIKSVNHLPLENQHLELIDVKENIQINAKFEFGLYTALNTTTIVNNATRRALDAKSLIGLNPSFGTNVGLQFVYHFNSKHSLVSALMHSNISQSYNKFSNGSLSEEEFNLNFVRLQALYQYKHKRHLSQKSAFNVKVGPYFGYLASSKQSMNSEIVFESLDYYTDFDMGISLQAGHSIDWKNIVLDYGLNIDQGLSNLNKGKGQLPASFDRTTLLGLGAYVSLRYKL